MKRFLKHETFLCLVSLSLVFIVSGCAAKKPTPAGFLNDYSFMKEGEVDKGLYVYRADEFNPGQYTKVKLDPVIIYFSADARGAGVDPDKLKELANFFYIEIVSALKDKYSIVEESGSDVLHLKIALTDVVANKPLLNLHWSTILAGFGLGGASMEAEFIDSQNQNQVLAIVDSRRGKRTRYTKGLKKWGHTEDVLTQWAQLLRETLDGRDATAEE